MATRTTLIASALSLAMARDIPANVATFYDSIVSQGSCSTVLASGFTSISGQGSDFVYCGDALTSDNVIFIQGPNGALANMDIDCDGIQDGPADDGRCDSSPSTQPITSFQWIVEGYGTGQTDLDANFMPYVVFGNTGEDVPGWPTFNPQDYGVEPLSLMAVVCGEKMIYGVWGDENGPDGDAALVGEASISLATACFGQDMNGNNGYNGNDVLYIAFPGSDAVPGADGAAWASQSFDEFEESITALGNRLVERIGSGGGGGCPIEGCDDDGEDECSWPGHCEGASCTTWDDCADSLTCTDGVCSPA